MATPALPTVGKMMPRTTSIPSMPTPEVPKRLPPTFNTLRELYLKSGNRCAFPGCNQSIFNDKGALVGQVCHIEAAEKGGERFNKDQTNEQRRAPSNLVLMCCPHHVETDDVDKFPVEAMVRIKTEHEKKFSDVVGAMLLSVTDHTTLTKASIPTNLNKLAAFLRWNLSDEEHAEVLEEFTVIIDNLSNVPIPSREFFSILVKRGEDGRFSADLQCSVGVVRQATGLSTDELRECFGILDNAGFTFDNDRDDFGVEQAGIAKAPSGWTLWSDLRAFCKKQKIDLAVMIVNLDFSALGD